MAHQLRRRHTAPRRHRRGSSAPARGRLYNHIGRSCGSRPIGPWPEHETASTCSAWWRLARCRRTGRCHSIASSSSPGVSATYGSNRGALRRGDLGSPGSPRHLDPNPVRRRTHRPGDPPLNRVRFSHGNHMQDIIPTDATSKADALIGFADRRDRSPLRRRARARTASGLPERPSDAPTADSYGAAASGVVWSQPCRHGCGTGAGPVPRQHGASRIRRRLPLIQPQRPGLSAGAVVVRRCSLQRRDVRCSCSSIGLEAPSDTVDVERNKSCGPAQRLRESDPYPMRCLRNCKICRICRRSIPKRRSRHICASPPKRFATLFGGCARRITRSTANAASRGITSLHFSIFSKETAHATVP